MPAETDLLIVGGGINGAGIARDAAGRGYSVVLCEQGDLAEATSSASTKLIHGGLRYLEYYEFRLVREALIERERLLAIAPHIIHPLRFVLPHESHLRPAWMIRLGLFLYDHLGGRKRLAASSGVRFDGTGLGVALKPGFTRGFAYADCRVDDSRLVVLNAMAARERGAEILTRTRFVGAERNAGIWRAELADVETGALRTVDARILVNAAGPWVARILGTLGLASDKGVRLIKGSHIVVPRLYDGEHAYMLQNPDRRIVFTIPYERDFTLIGTTDTPFVGDPAEVAIGADEIAYLCASVSRYFTRAVAPPDIVWSYAGVRPLYDDSAEAAAAVTRDYVLDLDTKAAPLLSVFGGKITTYRRLAEHAIRRLAPFLPPGKPWTASVPLPGGDIANLDIERFVAALLRRYAFLPQPLARRLACAYGMRAAAILDDSMRIEDLGEDFGGGLTRAELDYLVSEEWARRPEDVLWRRSKLGLHAPPGTAERIAAHLAARATVEEDA
ncbi:MAG: glycerol-3-phosphate dehydrogenase [Aliidongia sp.]|nr:glycerol-3-phosphate dehydrogenase [Aliidongia sp.]